MVDFFVKTVLGVAIRTLVSKFGVFSSADVRFRATRRLLPEMVPTWDVSSTSVPHGTQGTKSKS